MLILNYNAPVDSLKACVASVDASDYPDLLEIVVAENGSSEHHDSADDDSADRTRPGQAMGTPAFMPPEQALGQTDRVERRSDVFALGAVLCAVLTGRPPYAGKSVADVLRRAAVADLTDAHARLAGCGA